MTTQHPRVNLRRTPLYVFVSECAVLHMLGSNTASSFSSRKYAEIDRNISQRIRWKFRHRDHERTERMEGC